LEILLIALLLSGLAALHLRYAFVFRVDSDETQHLHVVWGWTQGLLPYRDFFDNHAPLFSWLCAPVLRAFGERTDIVSCMRLVLLGAVVLCLICTYRLGAFHFGRRAGWWAALATGFFPVFFYTSSEVRPDTLWTALWLASLAVLLTGRANCGRLFLFGAVFGLAFATSLKTVLLAAALLLSALAALAAGPRVRTFSVVREGGRALAIVAGVLLAPAAFAVFFALEGAWKPFLYCLVDHNVLPGMAGSEGWLRPRSLIFPVSLPVLFFGARTLWRRPGVEADPWRRQRIILLLAAFCYPILLASFWPLLTRQDYLPAIPVLSVAVIGLFFGALAVRNDVLNRICNPLLPAALILAEIAAIFSIHGPWRDRTRGEDGLIAAALRLTGPGDFIMDLKGETIFRRRPFYYALEAITRERIARGLIADDIPQRLVATRTAVVHSTKAFPFPPTAQAFVDANYLSVGPLSVLGKVIAPEPPSPDGEPRAYRFQIAVPDEYVVIGQDGVLENGLLDGEPLTPTGRRLQAGTHEFASHAAGRLIVFWANAWRNGFRPLALTAIRTSSDG
jgi:hypothetical protein